MGHSILLDVVVTGGCGFIGQHLVARLLREGCRVTVLDDLSSRGRMPEPQPGLKCLVGSVTDEGAVRDAMHSRPHLVFHLAAIVGMQRVHRNPDLAYSTSVVGAHNVLKHSGEAKVVFFSSSAVYGLTAARALREDDPIDESTALTYDGGRPGYALGKWVMEKIGRDASAAGRDVMILRPCNVVGCGQPASYGMVLPRFVEQALHNRPLTVYDDGLQTRTFSCVRTFADIVLGLTRIAQAWHAPINTINIGSDQTLSVIDLARLILHETGSSSPIEFKPYSAVFPGKQDVRDRSPDITRLRQLTGFITWPTIRSIVRGVIDSPRSHLAVDYPEALLP